MSAHKSIDRICIIVTALMLVLTALFCCGEALGLEVTAHAIGYENRLFDTSRVHSVAIVMDDWDSFIATCEREEYASCTVVIDGETVKNAGIRGKGNTSLSSVRSMNSSRYSFKLEFDKYDKTKSWHGLDKLCLNNIIQDNTYMKDYLAYTLMNGFGADAPLCSFAYITVNGEDWGLYLAVEGVEDSFLERCFGSNYGDLYKPDSMGFGGGRGNGRDFNMDDFMQQNSGDSDSTDSTDSSESSGKSGKSGFSFPGGFGGGNMPGFGDGSMPGFGDGNMPGFGDGNMPGFGDGSMPGFGDGSMPGFGDGSMPDFGNGSGSRPEGQQGGFDPSQFFGGNGGKGGFGGFGMGSSDVKLQYSDDNPESYANIFNNAKTKVSTADQKRLIASLKALSEQSDIENTVDTDAVLRYFVVHNFLVNGDSYTGQMIHNYYLYEKDGRLSMIPWDYNLAFGTFMGGNASSSVNSPIDTPVSGGMSDRPMIAWIFDSETYTEQYHRLFGEFLAGVDFEQLITDTAALIDSYVEKDPTKFCTYEDWQKGVAAIRSFCTLRAESIRGQLDGTIPATTEGQKADSTALIDTSGLNISDMGSMGGGFGRGRESRNTGSEKSGAEGRSGRRSGQGSAEAVTAAAVRTGDQQKPGNMPEGFDPSQFGGSFDPGNMPEGFDPGNMPEGFDPSQFGNRPGRGGQNGGQQSGEQKSGEQQSGEQKSGEQKSGEQKSGEQQPGGQGADSRPKQGSFPAASGTGQSSTEAYILLGISALVLLIGLGFALRFRR